MAADLLPCPLCSCPRINGPYDADPTDDYTLTREVSCSGCGLSLIVASGNNRGAAERIDPELRTRWNRRVATPAPTGEDERVQTFVDAWNRSKRGGMPAIEQQADWLLVRDCIRATPPAAPVAVTVTVTEAMRESIRTWLLTLSQFDNVTGSHWVEVCDDLVDAIANAAVNGWKP